MLWKRQTSLCFAKDKKRLYKKNRKSGQIDGLSRYDRTLTNCKLNDKPAFIITYPLSYSAEHND